MRLKHKTGISTTNKIIFGFSCMVILMIGMGAISIIKMLTLADATENIYKHPFAVSNAVKNINVNLISMHRNMKDVVLAEKTDLLGSAITRVNQLELSIMSDFAIINERFLGDKTDIDKTYQLFLEWRPIREEVISLMRQGKKSKAADITRKRGAKHVDKLNISTQKLIDFAENKADEFYYNAISDKKDSIYLVSLMLGATIFSSLLISVYVIQSIARANRETEKYLHLIDQNILIATTDHEGKIISASNALCRYLVRLKEEIVTTKWTSFFEEDPSHLPFSDIWKIALTGKTWEGEVKRRNKEGDTQWMSLSVHPQYNEDREITGYSEIITDITDKKMIEHLSLTDKLTGLYNRRFFDTYLLRQIKSAKRDGKILSLAILDIDFFKKYNDHYGHPEGDVALVRVGNILKNKLMRSDDYAFRLGGEEFACFLQGMEKEAIHAFLDEIRREIESLQIKHESSEVSPFLTVSIGAYICNGAEISNKDHLYIQADKALYLAKDKRNHVVVT